MEIMNFNFVSLLIFLESKFVNIMMTVVVQKIKGMFIYTYLNLKIIHIIIHRYIDRRNISTYKGHEKQNCNFLK